MKRYLKKSWLKNNLSLVNIITIFLYFFGLFVSKFYSNDTLVNLIGFFYVVFVTPLNLLFLFRIKLKGTIEYFLATLTIFFTVIVPLYFSANYFLNIPFSFNTILLTNLSISAIIIILSPLKIPLQKWNFLHHTKELPQKHWPILLTILLYIIIHSINYHFYVFMPEWDGYSNLVDIKKTIQTNILSTTYRGFFTVAIIIVSKISKLNPYSIFTLWFIALQASIVFVIYQFIKIYNINNKLQQFIILLSTLGIPVLSLEIDIVRPQTVFVILLPIYIYFIYRSLTVKNNLSYWILSSIIVIAGLNYHEFFLFLFLTHFSIITIYIFKKYYLQTNIPKNRLIFALLISNLIFIGIIIFEHLKITNYILSSGQKILQQVQQVHKWRLWFLDNYIADNSGQQLGWPGVFGAIKYYSYYFSPLALFYLVASIMIVIKTKRKNKKILLLYLTLTMIIPLLIYSELLPRLNYIFLPERIWLIIDILIIISAPAIFYVIKKYHQKYTPYFLLLVTTLSITGIAGTLYIAQAKKSLVSRNEFKASHWIRKNTPENAIFISQAANKPMIIYFSNRTMVPLSQTNLQNLYNNSYLQNLSSSPSQKIKQVMDNYQKFLQQKTIKNTNDIDTIISQSKQTKHLINKLKKEKIYSQKLHSGISCQTTNTNCSPPIYLLFSKDKFKTIYSQREWWQKANFFNLNPDKISKYFPLIYNQNGIYIWKIK